MKYNILFGGQAGQGPNFLAQILGKTLIEKGFYVFFSRDYQSLIRGGHNFNVLTFSDKPVFSNESELDLIVALDKKTLNFHQKNLKKTGIIIDENPSNANLSGKLFKKLGLEFKDLEKQLKSQDKFKENLIEAKKGYESETEWIKLKNNGKKNLNFYNGTQAIAKGAIDSGLDIYYAYPMTPATPLLGELAEKSKEKNILVLELENEIGIINAAIGSSITGAKSMIGTSGGGFDLMTEGLSLTGIAEIPLVIYLSQRPGPGTGVATYTAQGDLNIARHAGHGEFNRIVLAPGDSKESVELTNQCFYFSQKFKIPTIVLGDKHLAESYFTFEKKPKLTSVLKSTELKRYNSYESDSEESSTENPEIIIKNVNKRLKIKEEIEKESKNFSTYEIHGNKNLKNLIVSWGSTKGAIIDAIKDLNCGFLQIKYLEPFPKIENMIQGKNLILIENNSTGQLGQLISEKTGIFISDKNKILRFDGRPFLSNELKLEIKKRMR
ncbi:MAG: 2-oxoacid:acceptor oxidoreductase family protein [Candidatus Pacearchaeota archaeon]|jgi:2-oxoglutarate ferredoxin oxidoreductase subunit alpha